MKGKAYTSNNAYDYSLAYVDQQLGNLVSFLRRQGIMDKTMIVIVSDHGSRDGGMPNRENCDIIETYDELLHVPMAFIHSSIDPRVINRLHSVLDLAPTILELLGIPVPDTFRGESIMRKKHTQNEYILIENLGRGPCDFASKSINIGVRTDRYKLSFQNTLFNKNDNGRIKSFYDLDKDPHEMHNCKEDSAYQGIIETLKEIALNRCDKIRKENYSLSGSPTSSREKETITK